MCWQEKLSKYLPAELVDWQRISWYRPNRNWPFSVPLLTRKKHPRSNWVIEFKSYEQGREKMQARSIGGFWFSEQFPWDIFVEVLRGCRDYMFPGGQICEFTPVDPAKAVEVAELYRNWQRNPKSKVGWNFYRLNTCENTGVSTEWRSMFFQTVSEEMLETRMTGEFARYEGAIYQTFNPEVHLRPNIEWQQCKQFRRGIDWGASIEHPFVCLWAAQDGNGQWRVFDEYRSTAQESAVTHAINIIQRRPWPSGEDARFGTTWVDPSRPDNITLFAEMGIDVTPANNAVDAGIETVRHALKINHGTGEPGLIIDDENCPNLAKNIATYRWLQSSRKGLNPNAARPQPLKFQDDECDALRYILFSERTIAGATPDSLRLDLRKRESIQRAVMVDSGATGLYPTSLEASEGRERRQGNGEWHNR